MIPGCEDGLIYKFIKECLVLRSPVWVILDKSRSCEFKGKLNVIFIRVISSYISWNLTHGYTFLDLLIKEPLQGHTDIFLVPSEFTCFQNKIKVSRSVKTCIAGIDLHPQIVESWVDIKTRLTISCRQHHGFLLTAYQETDQEHHNYIH